MNYRILARYIGFICIAIGIAMLPSAAWAVYFREWHAIEALLASSVVCGVAGAILLWLGKGAPNRIYEREAIGLVGLSWIVTSALGALPFYFAGSLGFIDAYFESASGFTTSGCTVIPDIEAMEKSILFWRSFTHWIGGIGIVIMFVAVLPYFGSGGKLIAKSEATGPSPSRLRPRFRKNASLIVQVYSAFTVVFTIALMAAGMSFYDALCHTFGGLATGGFSNRQASAAAFESLLIELILIACMIVGGTNFALFAEMGMGNWKALWRDSEWKLYITILVLATVAITINLAGVRGDFPVGGESYKPVDNHETHEVAHSLRIAAFHVVSCMTTTGFVTDDFDSWPYFSRMLLVVIMIFGGCAGSTGSGIKVVRVLMMLKVVYWRLESTFRPKTVRPLRIDGDVVSEDVQRRTSAFIYLYVMWFFMGCLFLSWLGLPFESAFTAMIATLNNIGPGLEHVGAIRDYHLIGAPGTMFLSITMLLGRLEMIAILVLFMPGFWRN
ncbi:MAG: TrkH family potassium uptake protein [Candidatus Hydrogenedentes bacterium]|nr:TrkH family potassium uptake protein [Candidatus Hydrogenedentota bacterium]